MRLIDADALKEKTFGKRGGLIHAADIDEAPTIQPTVADCLGCNCPKMERLKEQKTFSEMVHLHDTETHDKRTETHACDLISRQAAIEHLRNNVAYMRAFGCDRAITLIMEVPSVRPDVAMLMQENTNTRKILHERCRRGTWVKIGAFLDGESVQCSNCGREVILNDRNRKSFNFCSNCGADMRGEQDG